MASHVTKIERGYWLGGGAFVEDDEGPSARVRCVCGWATASVLVERTAQLEHAADFHKITRSIMEEL